MIPKTAADKIAALQDKLKAARVEAKIAEQKRFAILGETVSDLMTKDAEFRAVVVAKLQAEASSKNKADLAPFLVS